MNANKKMRVIGVGGAGANIVRSMNSDKFGDMDVVIVNKVGENNDIGLDDKEALKTVLESSGTLFIVAGMGGETGTLGSCEIAKLAKSMGVMTYAIVTLPFAFEGQNRKDIAQKGVSELRNQANDLMIISSEDFVSSKPYMKNLSFEDLFTEINKVVHLRIIKLLA